MTKIDIKLIKPLNKKFLCMAEGVGLEPTRPQGPPVFKTGRLANSRTPPNKKIIT